MSQLADPFNVVQKLGASAAKYYSLPALEKAGVGPISKLPVSIRIVLESVLRNCGTAGITEADVKRLANWDAKAPAQEEIPFVVSRIVLQDFTGVPLLVDLAAMRNAVEALGADPQLIEPLVPVDLVVDHSVQVDRSGTPTAFLDNLKREFERNLERYEFLKWGQQAFDTFSVVPPAIGIVHQVNLEHLARVVFSKEINGETVLYPDTLVGTDSHTTMINGLGIVGWGVGGIEAEAGMLGQPVAFQTPEVIGVYLHGKLPEGVTATDLTLRITQLLRKEQVVGKFVEFYGPGAASLPLADRATIGNMAPEYGATMGFFPVDEKSLDYLRATGRSEEQIALVRDYFKAQNLFGIPTEKHSIEYTKSIDLDLASIVPSVAGPKRPQDRIDVSNLKQEFLRLLEAPTADGGYGKPVAEIERRIPVVCDGGVTEQPSGGTTRPPAPDAERSKREMISNRPLTPADDDVQADKEICEADVSITHGSVLIAAITSCTNTSNPSVMLAAGLLAKKAVEKGLTVEPYVKTSLAPGSRVVTDYLNETGLQPYLDKLGFNLVGYGCTTCIGNSGPLDEPIEAAIKQGDLVTASVLSGNRNFEARVHSSLKANFLMSPPLVVAYALAGRVDIDLTKEPLGTDKNGQPVYLKDIWPSHEEIHENIIKGLKPEMFREKYQDLDKANPEWSAIESSTGAVYEWDEDSTYIQHPPFFEGFGMEAGNITEFEKLRPMAILGDSVTTDHISPAGSFPADGPAGRYLLERGVEPRDFNSFGSRRGNDRIMTRGTFANVRIKNKMADGKEGGYTKLQPDGKVLAIYDAAQEYAKRGEGLIVFGGGDYGMGSSRDWAAKGTALLGIKAVVTTSFERIHRSNLIGMGVLPLCWKEGEDAETYKLDGSETFAIRGLSDDIKPRSEATLEIHRKDGTVDTATLDVRLDTGIEIEYYRHGGILPFVLRSILKNAK